MAFIIRSSTRQPPTRKTATFDFTPTMMSVHAKLFPNDWSSGNPHRKRTEEFCNVLGLNGHLFPNDVSTAFVKKDGCGSPYIRITTNIVDVCGKLTKMIPPFSSSYYAMIAKVVESPCPPLLKAYAAWYVTFLSFRLKLLSVEHMALFHAMLFDLAGNGTVSAEYVSFLRSKGCTLPEPDDGDFCTRLFDLPFPADFYGTLEKCASFRRAKQLSFELKKEVLEKLLQTRDEIVLTDDDWAYVDRCYRRLELTRDGEVRAEEPMVEAAVSNSELAPNRAARRKRVATKPNGRALTKKKEKMTMKAASNPDADDRNDEMEPTQKDDDAPPLKTRPPRATNKSCVEAVTKNNEAMCQKENVPLRASTRIRKTRSVLSPNP
uniref:EF-hand_13 domain-containing protein n=1 Tax=Panagrellus redivivus TaxID=6233 RepID=A0A7E4WDE7_PANRE